MASGKIYQQVVSSVSSDSGASSSRKSRTQRVMEKHALKKLYDLRKKAVNVQKEKFSNIKSIEEYKSAYEGLDPDIKQFFSTPEQVSVNKQSSIDSTISSTQERISSAKSKILELQEKYESDKLRLEEAYNRNSPEEKERTKERYKDNRRALEDDFEERRAEQLGIIKGLKEGLDKLKGSNDVSFDDIVNYATDIGNFERNREEARNDRRDFERTEVKDLETRQAEAKSKGFDYTGIIEQKFVSPTDNSEKVVGTKYYLKGAEASPYLFSKEYDVYKRPSGNKVIVPKGVDVNSFVSVSEPKTSVSVSKPINYDNVLDSIVMSSTGEKKSIFSRIIDFFRGGKKESYSTYNGIPFVKSSTKAVEVGTGRIARDYGLNTQNANLEDHYFIVTPEGEEIDVGILDKSKMGVSNGLSSGITGSVIVDETSNDGLSKYASFKEKLFELYNEGRAGVSNLERKYNLSPFSILKDDDALLRFKGGVEEGVGEQIIKKPVQTALTFASGAAIGSAINIYGASAAGSSTFGKVLLFGSSASAGALFTINTAKEVSNAPTAEEKGEILGSVGVRALAFGAGSKVGLELSKGYANALYTNRILKENNIVLNNDGTYTMYRGSQEKNLPSIFKEGLLPGNQYGGLAREGEGSVFLGSKNIAQKYGDTLLRVDLTKDQVLQLVSTGNIRSGQTLKNTMGDVAMITAKSGIKIDPSQIRLVLGKPPAINTPADMAAYSRWLSNSKMFPSVSASEVDSSIEQGKSIDVPYSNMTSSNSNFVIPVNASIEDREKFASEYLSGAGFEGNVSSPKGVDERTTFQKIIDVAKAAYASSIFGTSMKMPDKYLEQRKPISVSGSNIVGLNNVGVNIYSLEPNIALEAVISERQKNVEASKQAGFISDLSSLTENAPESIQYEVQQRGLKLLSDRGIESTYDEGTGVISFSSDELKPSRTYNVYELEKAKKFDLEHADKPYVFTLSSPERTVKLSLPYQSRGTLVYDPSSGEYKSSTTDVIIPEKNTLISPVSFGVKSRIIATKAAEFYIVGKAIGGVINSVTKGASYAYDSVGGGLKIVNMGVKGSGAYAYVEPQTPSFVGNALKITASGGLLVASTGLYTASKVKQYEEYVGSYGDVGSEAFKYETFGELLGLGALVAENMYNKEQERSLREEAERRKYLRNLEVERAKNIKKYGQYSEYAKTEYYGTGAGKRVELTDKESKALAKIYSDITGVSQDKALIEIRESGVYQRRLIVGSPSGLNPYESSRFEVVFGSRSDKGIGELSLEFSRGNGRITNPILKATTTSGDYSITSVFEKSKFNSAKPNEALRLQKTLVSKIVESKSFTSGGTRVTGFRIDSRLLGNYPLGNDKFTFKEALNIANQEFSEGELTSFFESAGSDASISPKPTVGLRVEKQVVGTFKGFKGQKLLEEYVFVQAGEGKRQLPLKNLLKDVNYNSLAKAQSFMYGKNPSTTSSFEGSYTDNNVVLENINEEQFFGKNGNDGISVAKATISKNNKISIPSYNPIVISPTIPGDVKMRIIEKLSSESVASSVRSKGSEQVLTLIGLLGLSKKKKLRGEIKAIKERQISDVIKGVISATDTVTLSDSAKDYAYGSYYSTPKEFVFSPIIPEVYNEPVIPNRPTRIIPPSKVAYSFDSDRIQKKIINRKSRKKGIEEFYLVPDFASRILGLEPETVGSEKEALKVIGRINTGLELRRGLRIAS